MKRTINFIQSLSPTVRAGYLIYLFGWVFNLAETAYFGWNMTPQSYPEKVCDWISVGIWIIGSVVLWRGILFDKATRSTIKDKFADCYHILFSKSYQIYYSDSKGSGISHNNLTIGEADKIAETMANISKEATAQERAVFEVNQILNSTK